MAFQPKPKQVWWLVICLGIVFIFSCVLTLTTPVSRVGEVIQVVPVTQIIQSTMVVPVTQIVPVTLIVPSTRIVDVVKVVTVTRIVEISPTPPSSPVDGIYFSIANELYRMNRDGSDLKVVTQMISPAEHSVVSHNKLYYSTFDEERIYAIDLLNPKNIVVLNSPGLGGQGLAIDPSDGKMYLGLYYNGVYAMDVNYAGTWTQLVASESLSPLLGQRGQLQIDPVSHHIYFRTAFNGDCGLCRHIWRVDFDGSNLTKIIPANGGDALALDLMERKLYFSDVPENGTIMRANLDGSEPVAIFAIPSPYRFCRSIVLDLLQRKIYLSLYNEEIAYSGRAIASLNMNGTGFQLLYEITRDAEREVSGTMALLAPQ